LYILIIKLFYIQLIYVIPLVSDAVSIAVAKSFDILFLPDDTIIRETVSAISTVLSSGQYESAAILPAV
jgi:hypothetical protein